MQRYLSQQHLIVSFLLVIVIASALDITADVHQGVGTSHLVQEALIMVIALLGAVWLAMGLSLRNRELEHLQAELEEIRRMPEAESPALREARHRLGVLIAEQFMDWKLSRSEQEVGMLLLKGLSLKDIATLRGTAEKTIRQQASAIYRKAGLSGRHAFSAWFIEDLL